MTRAVILLSAFFLLMTNKGPAKTMVVDSSSGQNLQTILDQSEEGDTLRIQSGIYSGPIHVRKTLTLIGENSPVIDGNGSGSVVYLEAPGILFKGFVIRNTGDLLSTEDTGLWATGDGIRIEENRFENVLFGIYLKQAPHGVVRNNVLISRPLDIARRGDLIRVWYSDDVLIEKNITMRGRDVVLWFSKNMIVRGNTFQEGRYGLHFMYCQQAVVEQNRLSNNSVGAYLMYSAGLQLRENVLSDNRGPSGYGIGFKDMEGGIIERNLVAGNRVGFFMDSCTGSFFRENMVAYNDIGMQVIPTARKNEFRLNSFVENMQQVFLDGSSSYTVNDWNRNHWSDYRGFDADQDGVGDVAYRPMKLFEQITDRYHALKVFYGSLSMYAIDFAAAAFPVFAPIPKFVDEFPLMRASKLDFESGVLPSFWPWIFLSVVFAFPVAVFWKGGMERKETGTNILTGAVSFMAGKPVIRIQKLTKRFKKLKAVSDLDLEILSGEVVALWGANGAGKTTLLRCLLGIIPCEGKIEILGMDVRSKPKEIRQTIGYVPQEIRLHLDHSVLETVRFYARLRRVSYQRVDALVHEWGLDEAKHKFVQNLSGGMRQKLAVVIALLSDPPVLFLDEPTSNLDVKTRGEFLSSLQKLKEQGKTLIFCSHRLSEIRQMADRVIVMESGVMKQDGNPEQVGEKLTEEISLGLTVGAEFIERARKILTGRGMSVSQKGNDLFIKVNRDSKAEPIGLLMQEGIVVIDFEVDADIRNILE